MFCIMMLDIIFVSSHQTIGMIFYDCYELRVIL